MFKMTSDIKFEGFKAVKPSALKWARSVDNYSDSALVVLPALCRFIDRDKSYDNIATGQKINEGTKVEISAGYDGKNALRFKGFVKRVNFKIPVEFECEGYAYQLRRKMVNKHYAKTTVKKVLEDLVAGTDIKLSAKMPSSIAFEAFTFRNYTGVQVLDFLKEKYLLSVFFILDELYVGWRATYQGKSVKFRLNWNIAKDDDLKFNTYTGSVVHIELESRTASGLNKRISANNLLKPGDVKRVRTLIQNSSDKQAAANDRQLLENKKGYSGSIVAFAEPLAEPGDTAVLIDKKYEERNGSYFTEGVQGSFDRNGGRQKVMIGFTV